jgi:arylformamidase
MFKPFTKIVDLTHEMYNGMPNIGGVQIAFWPIETHDGLAAITGGKTATVCWTGQHRRWGEGDWIKNRPYVPTDTARWLVDRGMTMFATDLISMDDPTEWWWPTHEIWLKAGICMTQQLCNLDKLAGHEFVVVAAPLKIRDGTGCPVRAFALVA